MSVKQLITQFSFESILRLLNLTLYKQNYIKAKDQPQHSIKRILIQTSAKKRMFPTIKMFSKTYSPIIVFIILALTLVPSDSQVIPLNATDLLSESTVTHQLIATGLLTCQNGRSDVRKICGIFRRYVDTKLRSTNIIIRRHAILFNYNDPTVSSIPTGHSCTVTAQRRSTRAYVYFDTSRLIKIDGNALNEPLVTTVRLRVLTRFYSDIRYRFGFKLFGCRRYARDTATVYGSLYTEAKAVFAVAINPTIARVTTHRYIITIEPRAVVLFDLDNTDISLRSRGRSPLTKIWIAMTTSLRVSFKAIERIFRGKSLRGTLTGILRQYGINIGHVLVLSWLDLPLSLRWYVFKYLSIKVAVRKAEKKAQKLGRDQEDSINEQLKKIFSLDSNGRRQFVIHI